MEWADWEQVYRMHANLPTFERKVRLARKLIDDAWDKGERRAVSVSWGKDSLAMLHLVLQKDPGIKVFRFDAGADYPEVYELRDRIVKEWSLNYVEYQSIKNGLDAYVDQGWQQGWICKHLPEGDLITKFLREHDVGLQFIGLRQEESNGRAKLIRSRGPILYSKQDQAWMCYPMAYWTSRDVFAYLLSRHIPFSDIYRKTKFYDDPGRIRTSWFCDPYYRTHGRYVWLKYYYPELWREMAKKIPAVKAYS